MLKRLLVVVVVVVAGCQGPEAFRARFSDAGTSTTGPGVGGSFGGGNVSARHGDGHRGERRHGRRSAGPARWRGGRHRGGDWRDRWERDRRGRYERCRRRRHDGEAQAPWGNGRRGRRLGGDRRGRRRRRGRGRRWSVGRRGRCRCGRRCAGVGRVQLDELENDKASSSRRPAPPIRVAQRVRRKSSRRAGRRGGTRMGDESFVVDLGQMVSVSIVVLDDTTHPLDLVVAYTLELSRRTARTFTAVKMGPGAMVTDIQFARVNARYIRIRQTGTTPAAGTEGRSTSWRISLVTDYAREPSKGSRALHARSGRRSFRLARSRWNQGQPRVGGGVRGREAPDAASLPASAPPSSSAGQKASSSPSTRTSRPARIRFGSEVHRPLSPDWHQPQRGRAWHAPHEESCSHLLARPS